MSFDRQINRKPDEQVVMALRRHPFVFLKPLLVWAVASSLPLAAGWMYFEGMPSLANEWLQAGLVLFAGTYELCLWLFLYAQFVDYYLDISVVTDRRIIEIDQRGLFNRSVAELDLSRVQDVTSEVKGFFATIVNYGDVRVQTAGELEQFVFQQVHNPHRVRERILELAHRDRKQEGIEIVSETLRGQGL